MNQLQKQMFLICVCVFALIGQAIADPLADAKKAYESGNYTKSVNILKPLAKSGNAKAQFNLGWMYLNGQGVTEDPKEAMKWFQLAAKQGNASAQLNLGVMYDFGNGVAQDYKEAMKWYQLSAKQGDALAQFNIGAMYSFGNGVPQDYKEAIKWWRLAAEQGDTSAQGSLGYVYQNGLGVPKNNVLAHMWADIVATHATDSDNKKKGAELRDSVAKSMIASQIAEAKKLAGKCAANKFKGC